MRKYFFFDIDGTLTSVKKRGEVLDSTINCIKELESRGHFVALATGRAHFRAKEFADQIGIKNMVCEGGNGLFVNGELTYYEPLNQELAKSICLEAVEKGFGLAVSIDDTKIRYSKDDLFGEVVGDMGDFMDVAIDPTLDYSQLIGIRRIFLALKVEEEAMMQSIKQIGFMRYADHPFVLVEPDDKFKGIRKMMEYLNADEKDVVVFGDGLNDVKMFQDAPMKIAMGNAIDELKELATFVSRDSDDDGIEYACKHFGWIDEQ